MIETLILEPNVVGLSLNTSKTKIFRTNTFDSPLQISIGEG